VQWQRLTVFRDAPDPELLRSVLADSCRLFRSHSTGAYFLEPADKHNETRPMLGGYYDSPFRLDGPFDLETLKAFEASNAEHKQSFHIHYDIVREAIFASRLFQTEVLSSYSNDEEDDFVAVAKNGELTHLRFEGYRKVIRTLSPEEAAGTESEFHAVRMDPPGKTVEDEPVCEYEAYEARMSLETELGWHPYWRYIEGELNGQVILRNLSHDPSDVPGQLMFRMAHLEFRNLFGSLIPDPYNEKDDYELVADYVPPHRSRARTAVRIFSGLVRGLFLGALTLLFYLTRKYWKYLLALLVLVGLGLLSSRLPPTEDDVRNYKFADHCRRMDGRLEKREGYSGSTGRDHCRIGDLVYLEHELPGQAGEIRRIAGTLEKIACEDGAEPTCLYFNGVKLNGPVTNADIAPDDRVITALRRTQVCDYRPTLVCEDGRSVFAYEVGTMFSLPENE
jgi:hypothetical protein